MSSLYSITDFISDNIEMEKMDSMFVIKRDGTKVPVSFDEVLRRIRSLSEGLEHVNPDLVAQKVCSQLENNMETRKLDEFAAETCATMQSRYHPNYGLLAARIVISNHQKNTPACLLDCVRKLDVNVDYTMLVEKHAIEYEQMIDYKRDFMFDYFGFRTLQNGYLLPGERPQHMWMRVAIQLHSNQFHLVRETYDALSQGYFIHATPTLYNAGRRRPQMSSCFLLTMKDDSIDGIYDTLKQCAQISKWAGGIGLSVHTIRARGTRIKGTDGDSTGLVPMLKVFNDTAKYVNQGGKRNGSFAIYLEPWHADTEEFLKLKLNQGAEEDRARDLFYAMWIPDLFMKRVEEDSYWTLMCPHQCHGLADRWGPEFEKLYTHYEELGKGRRIKAKEIWKLIMDSQIQTGMPYLCYKDAANSKSNQQNLGTIRSSNLCTEILEYSSPQETAVCNLGSLALPKFVEGNTFNFDKLRHYTAILTRNLDIVIDKNYYPTEETRRSNMRHRPIGIGVQGLADVFAKLRLAWGSQKANDLNREIFENIYYAAVSASAQRAYDLTEFTHMGMSEPGFYSSFYGSPASKGKLQHHLWSETPRSTYLDWETLKVNAQSGLRNSLLVAPMPTASTSQILGNNECMEPFTSNMYTRRVLAGDFMVVNKYLVEDLVKQGMWTSEIRNEIIANNGSIQNIAGISGELKSIYKTVWEIPQKVLIDMARDRAPFICQSQSLNLFLSDPSYSKLTSMHFYAWKSGLKTGCYYLRTKGAASAQKFTVEPCLTCSA
jgi:ribonucleoside-diphosphate reductase alpha chain